ALETAGRMLAGGDCDVVLAGAVQCTPSAPIDSDDEMPPDGVCLFAVCSEATAAARGLPVLSTLELHKDALHFGGSVPSSANGSRDQVAIAGSAAAAAARPATLVAGLVEVARAFHLAASGSTATVELVARTVRERARPRMSAPAIRRTTAARRASGLLARLSGAVDAATLEAAIDAAVQPVGFFTPALFPSPIAEPSRRIPARLCLLVDEIRLLDALRRTGLLESAGSTVVVPMSLRDTGAHAVDLSSDESIRASLETLDCSRFDAIVAVKDLSGVTGDSLIRPDAPSDGLIDLLFGVGRHAYSTLQQGRTALATL